MSKMVDKDELEFLKKMVSEGNIQSKLKKGAEVMLPNNGLPLLPSDAQKNLARYGSKELNDSMAKKLKNSALSKIIGKAGGMGLGKAAGLALGGPLAVMSELAEASSIAPSDNPPSIEESQEAARLMNKEAMLEELREKSAARSANVMNQDRDKDIIEKIAMDEQINSIANEGKSDENLEQEAARRLHKRMLDSGRAIR